MTAIAETKKQITHRNYSIDLIRIIAFCLVVTVHFFFHAEYYNIPLWGVEMFIATYVRNFAMSCVPLFLVITGFLMQEKTLKKGYYFGIVKTIITFLIAETGCMIYDRIVLEKSFLSQIKTIGVAHYSWYIDMYIGLFLIIPFLNLAYNGLKSQKQKFFLVLSFTAITIIIPSLFNIFKCTQGWWSGAYPLAYYYTGCYLKEYGFKLKTLQGISVALASNLLLCIVMLFVFANHTIRICAISGHNSVFVYITTVALFGILLKTENNIGKSKIKKSIVTSISRLTLGAYLISYVVDHIVYDTLKHYTSTIRQEYMWFPVVIITVIAGSLCLSYFINLICDVIMMGVNKLRKI